MTEGSIFEVNPCLLVAYFVTCDVRMYRGVGDDEESGRNNMGQINQISRHPNPSFRHVVGVIDPDTEGMRAVDSPRPKFRRHFLYG